ncbi:MAG: FAD-dependent oxidoreductase, partial [Deltaproteobacteria bacterium]|nr:FAD-dependent oxidoreductase [Deltaproteobacteria bacterium]
MDTTDIVIIGAGVVGLAITAELSGRFPERSIVLFERNSKCGQETSSRNSEVIHAGIYYPRDSLKANLCITGNQMLYRFCDEHDIPLQRLGKLIVATTDRERTALEELLIRGSANGVNDLRMLGRDETARLEPHIPACAALWSPSTGTVDSHRLMSCLEGLAARNGTLLSYRHEVIG